MKYKDIDIVIPTYNEKPGYLKAALDSCLNQSYPAKNIIIVNDSPDHDISYVSKLSPKIKYIQVSSNMGPAGARNIGVNSEHCTSELISFLDSDDIMDTNKLAYTILEFNKRSNIGMVCGNYQVLLNRKRLLKPFYKRSPEINWETLMRTNLVASGSTTVLRKAFDEVGGFDERFMIAEDYSCWLKISEQYKVQYINKVLYYYSIVQDGSTLTQQKEIQKSHLPNLEIIRSESQERVRGRKDAGKNNI